MESLGLPFKVLASNFDEEQIQAEDVRELVVAIAKGKADILANQYPNDLIITADSNNFFDGRNYGNPKSREQAKQWLMLMAGKSQEFHTGLVLTLRASDKQTVDLNTSVFTFKPFSARELDNYLAKIDPTSMAIGWSMDDGGDALLERFDGEPGAERALPLDTLRNRLREFGIAV